MNQQQQEWIIVGKPKRKQIKKEQKCEDKKKGLKIVWETGKPLALVQDEVHDLEMFIQSECYKRNFQLIAERIKERFKISKIESIHIQCLGLGDFIKYSKPRYQFMFLKHLLIPICQQQQIQKIQINCYDPIFTPDCVQQIKKLGSNMADNIPTQQKNKLIILYMPHCQRFLHQRYCRAYNKKQVLVIGNSIKDYKYRCQLISETVPDCFVNFEVKEYKLEDFKQSFNDTFCYYI